MFGYLSNLVPIIKYTKKIKPDIIHAHYGLSSLLANLQRQIPVITTFHGSDINNERVRKYSKWAHRFSYASIFVSEDMKNKLFPKKKSFVIPCGIDIITFYPIINNSQKEKINIKPDCYNILFSSSFNNHVKNYPLANNACIYLEKLLNKKVNLIELKDFNRQQVNLLINSVDCVLLTSFSEGSPQFIKEAMACNKPIVATNVGDIKWLFENTKGSYLTSFDPIDVAEKIKLALEFSLLNDSTNGRERIINLGLDSETIANKIIEIYNLVIRK